jgi:hypothetical protein
MVEFGAGEAPIEQPDPAVVDATGDQDIAIFQERRPRPVRGERFSKCVKTGQRAWLGPRGCTRTSLAALATPNCEPELLPRTRLPAVIAATSCQFQPASLPTFQFNAAVAAVCSEVSRFVGHQVLTAQLLLDRSKRRRKLSLAACA